MNLFICPNVAYEKILENHTNKLISQYFQNERLLQECNL